MNKQTEIYAIEIEPTSTGYSAYAPDIEGCVATGKSQEEVVDKMREAIEFHFEGLALQGVRNPEPTENSKS